MNKKGVSGHIDWVIGLGLFIVFLGLMLTFFKPGVEDVFEEDTLLDIVEESFITETNWQIIKQPVFLESIEYIDEGADVRSRDGYYTFEGTWDGNAVAGDFPFSEDANVNDEDQVEVFFVPQERNQEVRGRRAEGAENRGRAARNNDGGRRELREKVEEVIRPESLVFGLNNRNPQFYIDFQGNQDQTMLITYSDKRINFDDGATLANSVEDIGLDFNPENKYVACQDAPELVPNDNCNAKYTLGATETLEGLSIEEIVALEDYENLKSSWEFPDSKEFKIRIFDNDQEFEVITINDREPPMDSNVYARTFNTQILNDDSMLVPVTVNILIW